MHIGRKINQLIVADPKFSKKGLAEHLNKTRQAVYDIIKNPDINTRILRKIAEYFDVSLSIFIEDHTGGDDNILKESYSAEKKRRLFVEERLEILEQRVRYLEEKMSEAATV